MSDLYPKELGCVEFSFNNGGFYISVEVREDGTFFVVRSQNLIETGRIEIPVTRHDLFNIALLCKESKDQPLIAHRYANLLSQGGISELIRSDSLKRSLDAKVWTDDE